MSSRLRELLGDLPLRPLGEQGDAGIRGATGDSRRVGEGVAFVAVPGHRHDGHDFLAAAAAAGAAALLVQDAARVPAGLECPAFAVPDARAALARLVRGLAGHPDRALTLVAVTGTNGKTTVAHLVRDLLRAAGRPCGLLGTIRYQTGARDLPAPLTTPGAEDFFPLLAEMHEHGLEACAMEASSHALDQQRLGEAEVDVAAFTNLSRDHLDYHDGLEGYLTAKRRLLERLAGDDRAKAVGRAVVNLDDEHFRTVAWPTGTVGVGRHEGCALRLLGHECDREGTTLRIARGKEQVELRSPLLGGYNAENLLVVAGVAEALGLPAGDWPALFGQLHPVKGRLEPLALPGGPLVLVDYAHTPEGIVAALAACRELGQGRLRILFGCGGDRDRGKRPLMLRAALDGADEVVLTSDNPRHEDPERILDDAMGALRDDAERARCHRIADRAEALAFALGRSAAGDTLLVAGKGHEDYQVVGDSKHAWDDREHLRAAWSARGRG